MNQNLKNKSFSWKISKLLYNTVLDVKLKLESDSSQINNNIHPTWSNNFQD